MFEDYKIGRIALVTRKASWGRVTQQLISTFASQFPARQLSHSDTSTLQHSNLAESDGGMTQWIIQSILLVIWRTLISSLLEVIPLKCYGFDVYLYICGRFLTEILELRKGLQYKSLTRSKGAIWELADGNLWWMGSKNSRCCQGSEIL